MSSSRIDPEFRLAARVLPRNLARFQLTRIRRLIEGPLTRLQRRTDLSIEMAGSVRMRVHHPPAGGPDRSPGVLWIHGGGFIGGSPGQDDRMCRRLAREFGAVVAAVDYRLAPEHRFPAAVEDCHAALVWLAARPDVDSERLAIVGASAGGGLTAQLALLARERGEVRPCFQAMVYPMLDDRTALRTDIDERGFRIWNNAANGRGWRSYLGLEPGADDVPTQAAPARHADLADLPPAWIGVGSLDLFHDEDVEYARRLRAAGVPCELIVVDGVFHGFDVIRPSATASRRFHSSMINAIATGIGRRDAPTRNP